MHGDGEIHSPVIPSYRLMTSRFVAKIIPIGNSTRFWFKDAFDKTLCHEGCSATADELSDIAGLAYFCIFTVSNLPS